MDEQLEKNVNSKEKCFLELYREIHFEQNPVCHKCRKEGTALKRPIGAWLIGVIQEQLLKSCMGMIVLKI